MSSPAFDYIRNVNALSEELLLSHGDLLRRKNICRKLDLIRVIKLDLDKLAHALMEVKDGGAPSVLRNFFAGSDLNVSEICARMADRRIYHLGFEIHEPLDLVLYGINHWIEHSRRAMGATMRVKDFLRFPASQAFQKRVGAYTEIMRIWIETGERVLMLELFDIHRPADSVLASAPPATHRNFTGLFRSGDVDNGEENDHDRRLAQLFAPDEIWHYALHVRQPADVIDIHAWLQQLTVNCSDYLLPYEAPVHNPHDDSFHTKIVRQFRDARGRREIEFVTRYSTTALT
jgi:hypothetical protein